LVELRKIPPDAAEYLPALRQIAQLCLSGQRDGEAKEALLALEAGAPQDPWAQISLAEVFRRQGALALALHHAQRGAELDPSPPGTHFLIAELLDDLDRQAEMIAPLRKVIERQPDHYAAHLNLAYAYSQAGQPNGTRKEAEWCLVRNPNDVDARRLLATAARDEGRHAEAKEELKKALALSPDDINCRLLEAELLLFDRQAEAAFQRLQPLYPHYPKEARVLGLLAQAATAAGRPAEAEKYRQQIENLKKR
jgi:predicted Zn-dependent protease